ncbi:hypothetical protein DN745_07645 [Bradymonas sediminis]|uniref:Uncharacterized protein n=1 Tax=Bradymonas sediminis TaxID=1548548 RepID=A0A2Z4FK19_9DELT|nr:hypothetical protein DN745_07645 [Bradymonas sediminis]
MLNRRAFNRDVDLPIPPTSRRVVKKKNAPSGLAPLVSETDGQITPYARTTSPNRARQNW